MTRNSFIASGALLGVIFLVLVFREGWALGARLFLLISYWLSVIILVASAALAVSLRALGTDRSLWMLATLAVVLGLVCYLLLGWEPLYSASLLSVGGGAIIGLGLRLGRKKI
jgi:hypothetical protein